MKKAKSIYFINIVFQYFYLSNPWPLYYDTTSSYSLLHLSLHFQISYPCPDIIFSSSFYSTIPVLTFWNLFPYINSKLSSYYLIPILTFSNFIVILCYHCLCLTFSYLVLTFTYIRPYIIKSMSLHSYFLALTFFIHIFIIFHPCYLILASLYSPIPVITLSYSGHVSILSFSLHSLILSLYYLNTLFIHYSCPFIYLYPTIYFLIPVLTLSHPYPYILLSPYLYSHRYILISLSLIIIFPSLQFTQTFCHPV